jgi:hypothetical protein
MTTEVTGTFTIENWDENDALPTDGGSKVTRASVARSFEGGLEGEGTVEWLMAYGEDGTAAFVGLERVVGAIDGRPGTLVLEHVGTFDGKQATAELTIVEGSGTGELTGVTGTGSFEAGLGPDGVRSIRLELR